MSELWERDKDGKLIPNEGKVIIKDDILARSAREIEFRLTQLEDEKQIAVTKRALELIKEDIEERKEEHNILFVPLLPAEVAYMNKGLSCDGEKILDIEADVCSKKCKKPMRPYSEWRDMKDPTLKSNICNFILDNSTPKTKLTEKQREAFQLLRELA